MSRQGGTRRQKDIGRLLRERGRARTDKLKAKKGGRISRVEGAGR